MPDDEAVLSDSDASSSDGGGGDDDDSASSDDGMGGRQEDERERSIRYNPNRSAKRIGGEFTAYDHRGKRTTHFHNALANGEFDRYRGGDPQGAGTIDARRILDNDAADVSSRGAGFAVNLYQFGCVEKAIKLLFPAEPEAAMIQKWIESATNLDVVCDFTPFSDEIIVSLLTFYTAKPTQTINGFSCYGLAYGQARAMLAGIIMAHRELGFAFTPTKMPAIAHLLKRIEANSDPKGAASFDPAEDLKPMTQGLMCHPGRPFLKRIQDCTMLVLHFYLMARVSDMTVFAFDASDIKWPKNNSRHFGLDGQPLFCDVTLKQSKGKRKKADSHKRARSESPPALEPPALEPDSPPPLEPYSLGDLELAADIAAAGSIVNIYRSPFSPDPQRYKTAALPPDRPLPVLYGCVLPSVLSQPPLP